MKRTRSHPEAAEVSFDRWLAYFAVIASALTIAVPLLVAQL